MLNDSSDVVNGIARQIKEPEERIKRIKKYGKYFKNVNAETEEFIDECYFLVKSIVLKYIEIKQKNNTMLTQKQDDKNNDFLEMCLMEKTDFIKTKNK